QHHQAAARGPGRRGAPLPQAPQGGAARAHPGLFGDVVGGVPQQDDAGAGGSGGVGQQGVTGGAGGGGQAGGGLVAGPDQTPPVGPGPARGFGGEGGPAGAVGIQPVVDGQGQQTTTAATGPAGRQIEQRHGIAAARQGQGDRMGRVDLQA